MNESPRFGLHRNVVSRPWSPVSACSSTTQAIVQPTPIASSSTSPTLFISPRRQTLCLCAASRVHYSHQALLIGSGAPAASASKRRELFRPPHPRCLFSMPNSLMNENLILVWVYVSNDVLAKQSPVGSHRCVLPPITAHPTLIWTRMMLLFRISFFVVFLLCPFVFLSQESQ